MYDERIAIKGNKHGINAIIQIDKFGDFQEMSEALLDRLRKGKKFYRGANLIITTDLEYINDRQIRKLKDALFDEILIKDCEFVQREDEVKKVFSGIHEGKTKFIRGTIRSGQIINYTGNLIIIGDVNHGAEVRALGNIIVLGILNGRVYAGDNGNNKAIIAALLLEPEILSIAGTLTISPDEFEKANYPEVAKLRDGEMVIEPYLPGKYSYETI